MIDSEVIVGTGLRIQRVPSGIVEHDMTRRGVPHAVAILELHPPWPAGVARDALEGHLLVRVGFERLAGEAVEADDTVLVSRPRVLAHDAGQRLAATRTGGCSDVPVRRRFRPRR